MVGDIENTIPDYNNHNDKIGFVFIGTHDQGFLDKVFKSRLIRLMNESNTHFIFFPQKVCKQRGSREF